VSAGSGGGVKPWFSPSLIALLSAWRMIIISSNRKLNIETRAQTKEQPESGQNFRQTVAGIWARPDQGLNV
ncbi:MAG TPA: hypothetical protein VLH15_11110, partial [Dehalococcoidales bacterium]|nr:hypothetical protein [Dehalococcoidales bacterium]